MQTLFSTAAVHPRHRFDYWHAVACANLLDHDSTPACRDTFRAELLIGAVAEIGLVLFQASPMSVAHNARHAGRSNTDELFVCRLNAGGLALEQLGREVMLRPGDITLLDPRLPYVGRFAAGSELLVLKAPRRLVEVRLGRTQEMTACSVEQTRPEMRLASSFLAMLPHHSDGLSVTAGQVVRNQLLDLVALALANATHTRRPNVSSARTVALAAVRAAVETRLSDPALDAEMVAAAASVSVRYANALLAESDTSIRRLIQSRRLARCRQALEDPSQARRTLTEIAYGWGFSDMTHFGRKFKAAYGVLPSEYRKACSRVTAT